MFFLSNKAQVGMLYYCIHADDGRVTWGPDESSLQTETFTTTRSPMEQKHALMQFFKKKKRFIILKKIYNYEHHSGLISVIRG